MTKNYSDSNLHNNNEPRPEVIKRIMAFSKAYEANKNVTSKQNNSSSSSASKSV